jgi:FkbM family methyltransferase
VIPPRPEVVREKPVHTILMRDGFWLCGHPDTYMFKALARNRTWEPHMIGVVGKHLRRGWTFIDAGAGLGFWTLYASRVVGASGQVLAFEPCAENFRLVALSVSRARRNNVRLYPVALGDELCLTRLWQNPDNDGDNRVGDVGANVVAVALDDLLADELTATAPTMQPWRIMLKLDVQGHEPRVLRGAARFLYQFRPIVVSEDGGKQDGTESETVSVLRESGYTVEYIKAANGKESRDLVAVPYRR